MRSRQTGKIRGWMMRTANGAQTPLALQPRTVVNDPDALCHCTLLGMGVALLAMPDVLQHLERGALQRVLPQWYVDAGPISLYFASNKLLPVKTRAFVDFVTGHFQQHQLARRLSAG